MYRLFQQIHHVTLALILVAVSISAYAKNTSASHIELANRYTEIRAGAIIKARILCIPFSPFESHKDIYALKKEVLSQHSQDANWNAKHSEWIRIGKVIDTEINQTGLDIYQQIMAPSKKLIDAELDEVAPEVIKNHFAKNELESLLTYYSQSVGSKFIDAQSALFQALEFGIGRVRAKLINHESRSSLNVPQREFEDLLSLFDEYVQIEWARTKPQNIEHGHTNAGLWVASGVSENYSAIGDIWNRFSDQEKASILAWRSSAQAKNERESIAKVFGEIYLGNGHFCSRERNEIRKKKILNERKEKWLKLINENQVPD